MKLGTLTTGVGIETRFQLPYCPAAIHYNAGTQLQKLEVNVQGDGTVCNLDADGLSAIALQNRVTGDQGNTIIPLADGLVNKNTEIVFTNSAAQTPDVFQYSRKKGSFYIQSGIDTIFAGSGKTIVDFAVLMLPNFVDADRLDITYRDGFTQEMFPADLRLMNSFENQILATKFDFYINNVQQIIKSVNFIPNAQQSVYFYKFRNIGNL